MARPPGLVDPARWVPVTAGLCALAIGLLVYVADRPAGHAVLIPTTWSWSGRHPVFGAVGTWLPSAVHPFAFGLFTAALLPRSSSVAWTACAAWWVTDMVAECMQHPALSAPMAAAWGTTPGLAAVARYAQAGRFDIADLAATTAGALGAAWLLRLLGPAEVTHAP